MVAVAARGKHLLIEFSGGLTLRTHLRMTGSWHLYRPGERWRKGPHLARVVLEVEPAEVAEAAEAAPTADGAGWIAVCFAAPVVELFPTEHEPVALQQLGPDLCRPEVDLDVVVERLATIEPGTAIADALLDQRVAAGIGNVYKSEVLFVCAIDPFTPVDRLDDATRRRLYEVAGALLRANLGRADRVTFAGGQAVYGRRGQPCRRCGTPIRSAVQGPVARSTYWCPTCQPPLTPPPGR